MATKPARNANAGALSVDDINRGGDLVVVGRDGSAAPAADLTTEQLNAGGIRDMPDDSEFDGDPNEGLFSALAELGDNAGQARVVVYRKPTDPRNKPAYVNEWFAVDFKISELAAAFGGGSYQYRVMGADGRFLTRGLLNIEEPKNPGVIRSTNAPAPVGTDGAEIANAILAAIKPLIDRPQKSTLDLLGELKMMREVFAPPPGVAAAPATTPMDELKKMFEFNAMLDKLRGSGGGDSGGGSVWGEAMAKLVEQFAPSIVETLKAGAAAKAAGVDPAPAQLTAPVQPAAVDPIPNNNPAASGAPVQPAGEIDMNLQLKLALSALASKAQANADPALYAHVVYDNLPDDATIIDLCTRIDWFEYLCKVNDAIKPFHAWFISLRADLVNVAIEDGLLDATGRVKTAAPAAPAQS